VAKKAATPTGLSHDARIVILHGPEGFLRTYHTTKLKDALAKHFGQVDTIPVDGATAQPADVLDECRSFGLIASHKLIVVDQAEALVKDTARPLFERYAENPSDGATLVLRSGAWRPGNLDKMVEKVGAVLKCETPGEDACVGWAVKRAASEHKATLEPDAAQALVANTGADLGRIDMELAKLAAAAGGPGEGHITRALVAQLVGVSRDEEAWGVQQSLLSGNPERAVHHLRHVLEVSRQPAPLVMFAVTDLARKLHGVCCATHQKRPIAEVTKPLKLWGPSQYAVQDAAKRLRPAQTMSFLRACVRADQRSKSGLGDVERSLEALALELQRVIRAGGNATGSTR
jgi:DNA polymerase III delta subunit